LENKDFEHENWIKGWTASFAPIFSGITSDFLKNGTKTLPVNEIFKFEDTKLWLGDFLLMIQSSKKNLLLGLAWVITHTQSFAYLRPLENLNQLRGFRRHP